MAAQSSCVLLERPKIHGNPETQLDELLYKERLPRKVFSVRIEVPIQVIRAAWSPDEVVIF
jgi:hypothetical protein